ncbi:hypothetical protein [Variovorax ginsengisoli]|uniref:Uncharacterized protein n=1 Tax=Variovorax ginsengisoli TaxID=363844 RepID=A0ABT9S9J1_9BURK|nr:hypothetical protein [Variovorax ginsengisoli]MDP9901033.1 hypothetical protein [Variovorax ginsengisoli]
MERLLVLKLDTQGCEAEALINGVPVARAGAASASVTVPVHEYTLAGTNRLELVVGPPSAALAPDAPVPPPVALVADGHSSAHLRVLLPRAGNPTDEASARELAVLDWVPPARQAYEAPVSLSRDVDLPVNFVRWRWLDAPAATPTPAVRQAALALLKNLAQALSDGDIEFFIAQVRLRTEELAAAYAQPADQATDRLRTYLSELHATGRFQWLALEADALFLRRLAGGRLLECLYATGAPALRTAPDAHGRSQQFPIRLAVVEGKLYVLR